MVIRRARPEDAERLTAIAHAAKRHWGYPENFLRLWKADLTVTTASIAADIVYCALRELDIVGFYALSQEATVFELEHMWVEPAHMEHGYGSLLFRHAVETVRSHGGTLLRIASDPHAEEFYRRMGARRVGEQPSVPAGRTLPLLVVEFDG